MSRPDITGCNTLCPLSLAAPQFLESKSQLRHEGAGRDEVCAAERREKIVQGHLIGQVEGGKLERNLGSIGVKKIVETYSHIKEVPWRDARGIRVNVDGSGRRDHQARGAELRIGQIAGSQPVRDCGEVVSTEEADGGLLVGVQAERRGEIWYCARNHSAVVPPGEGNPRPFLRELVLNMG